MEAGVSAVVFWAKFYSEEFLEYCGSQYQDTFSVSVSGVSFDREVVIAIDDLCSVGAGSCGACPSPPPSCAFTCLGTDACNWLDVAL